MKRGTRLTIRSVREVFSARDPARARLVVATAVSLGVAASALFGELIIRELDAERSLLAVAIFLSVQTGNMVSDKTTGDRLVTTALLAPTVVLAVLSAGALSSNRIAVIAVFVLISGAGIWVRRFGERAAALGAITFMGYFFALFMKPSDDELLAFCLVAAGAISTQVGVRAALMLKRPRRELAVLLEEFRAASDAALAVAMSAERPAALRRRLARIDSISVAVASWQLSYRTDCLIGADAATLDDRLLDARVDTEEVCDELVRIARTAPTAVRESPELGAVVTRLRAVLAGTASADRIASLSRWAETVTARDHLDGGNVPELAFAEYLVARAVLAHVELRRIDLTRGMTAGAAPIARSAPDSGRNVNRVSQAPVSLLQRLTLWRQWNPSARMAVQAMIAALLASAVGEAISASRWYWAVMTAFVIFIGAATRSGILTRAFRRISGTALGLVVGVAVVYLAGASTPALVGICLLGVFGMLYFGPLNSFYSAVFLSVMLTSLYRLLGVLSGRVLELRLEETAAGALVGVLCAYLIVSANSKPVLEEHVNGYFDALGRVLDRAVAPLATSTAGDGLRAGLKSLELAQEALDRALSAMSTAFLVAAARQEENAVHVMYIVTRSASRLVQVDSAVVRSSPRVIESIAAVKFAAAEARVVLRGGCGEHSDPRADLGDRLRPAEPSQPGSDLDQRSAEAEALVALGRMRWALQQL